MNKVTTILFAVYFLISTIGIAVNVHYCSGQLKSVAILVDAESCCDDASTCGCCKDETFVFQHDVEDVLLQNVSLTMSTPILWVATLQLLSLDSSAPSAQLFPNEDGFHPPKSPIWLKNCTLTYYG